MSLPASPLPMRPNRIWFILLGLIVLGGALRFAWLGQIPLGLHHDEGYNALDALDILAGWRPVFLPGNNGREPLFIYLTAFSIRLFGATPWAVRLPGALAGVLIIPAQYLLVASLPLPRPRLTALLSAALVTVTFWPIAKGHQGLRAGMLPLWTALALWAWWRSIDRRPPTVDGRRSRGLVYAALAGLFTAAAIYTHTNGRVLMLVLVGSALWVAARERRGDVLGWLGIALVVAGLLALPLGLYFRDNPDLLGLRTSQVSVFNPAVNGGDLVGTLLSNAWKLLLAPIVRGTDSGWENLPNRPVFDPLMALAFLVGAGLLLVDLVGRRERRAQSAAVLLTLTLAGMAAPSWLSDGAPHYGRLTGIWPVLFLLPAWGLERGVAWLTRRTGQQVALAAVVGVLAVSAAWSGWDFFGRYAVTPEVHDEHRGAAIARGEAIAGLVGEGATYVSPAVWSQTPIRMVNWARPPRSFDPRQGMVLPPTPEARYVFEVWEEKDAEAFRARWPVLERQDIRSADGAVLLVYRLRLAAWPLGRYPLETPAPVFGDNIRLEAHSVGTESAKPGGKVELTLEWGALSPTSTDLNFFVHLVAADGRMLGQTDGAPLGGSYATNEWVPGERIIQTVSIPVAKDASAGTASLRVGWYDWRNGIRLPAPVGQDDAVIIGQVRITP